MATQVHPYEPVLNDDESIVRLERTFGELENNADWICLFQASIIPGLLQTAPYTRQVLSRFKLPDYHYDVEQGAMARLERQQILGDESKQFDFLMTEAALRWAPINADRMRAQLERVVFVAGLNNVSIGVIPQDRHDAVHTYGSFSIFERDGKGVVHLEALHAGLTITDADASPYRYRWDQLTNTALGTDESLAFLRQLLDE